MKNLNLERKEINSKGITLVALIVTIIVLLILAGVTIVTLTGDNGLLTKSKLAVDKYSDGEIEEQIKLAYQEWQLAQLTGTTENANDFIKNRLNSSIGNVEEISVDNGKITVIINKNGEDKIYYYNVKNGTVKQIELAKNSTNKNDSYVGCYADIDEDGVVDGVIFVDLLTGSVRDTQKWIDSNGAYSLPTNVTASNVNAYYISQDSYTDSHFGTHPVITPTGSNGSERFYIMSLTNFTSQEYIDVENEENSYPEYDRFTFFKNAFGNMVVSDTSVDFGKGKTNTATMIARWNANSGAGGYTNGTQDNRDIWKHIQTEYSKGWFVPSRGELAAFANELGITGNIAGYNTGNFNSKYGLNIYYWSSSLCNSFYSWYIRFYDTTYMGQENKNALWLRLATTF